MDARHTNLALEARKLGYEPALFGYTDTTPDPRPLHPNDPSLTAYDEGVLPGFSTPLHLPEDMGKRVSHLKALGYDIPHGRDDVFRPRPGFDKPADRGFRFIPPVFKAEHSETAFLTDEFLKWLLVRETKPWFAHFVFFRPHSAHHCTGALQRGGTSEGRGIPIPQGKPFSGRRPASASRP